MNKAQLIDKIAANAEAAGKKLSKAEAAVALEAFVSAVTDALANEDRVSLVGFGSWSVDQRNARTGRNPRTGEEIQIAAKNVVKFKPGASLTDAVN